MNYRLWERLKDWVILFALLTTSMLVLVARNEPVVRALRAQALETTSGVESQFAWVGGYFRALDENDLLREENINLASEVARSREATFQSERLRRLLGFRDTASYPMIPARVVARDITETHNYLTINVGSNDSIKVGMPVVDERGIIGVVEHVSASYALVMPYLNMDFRVPAIIQALRVEGVVRWEGVNRDELLLEYISRNQPVLKGQLVVTSGASGNFPAGYPIGFIDSTATIPGVNQLEIFLTPTSPISQADYVFVLLREQSTEIATLQEFQRDPVE
jgi:rod shape-determining protein MreC